MNEILNYFKTNFLDYALPTLEKIVVMFGLKNNNVFQAFGRCTQRAQLFVVDRPKHIYRKGIDH